MRSVILDCQSTLSERWLVKDRIDSFWPAITSLTQPQQTEYRFGSPVLCLSLQSCMGTFFPVGSNLAMN